MAKDTESISEIEGSDEEDLRCEVCGALFPDVEEKEAHIAEAHPERIKESAIATEKEDDDEDDDDDDDEVEDDEDKDDDEELEPGT